MRYFDACTKILTGLSCGRNGCPCVASARNRRGLTHCPAHEDATPSLSVHDGKTVPAVVRCMASCTQEIVLAALVERGLWPDASPNGKSKIIQAAPKIAATYDYRDGDDALLYQVLRHRPRGFKQRRPDGRGGWCWSLDGVARVLFRLPELLAADSDATVYIPEGEKDVDRLAGLGLIATCNSGGAGKWRDEYSEQLRGRNVYVYQDNDDTGREHAQAVASSLCGKAASVKVIILPGLPEHGDVSDWLDQGGSLDELLAIGDAAPCWEPEATGGDPGSKLSAQPIGVVWAERNLVWRTAREVATATPTEVAYVVEPWLVAGATTELDGKVKVGKTEFTLGMVRKILDGADFLGKPCRQSGVVLLTEQAPASFSAALKRAGLASRDDLVTLFWHEAIGIPWTAVVQHAAAKAQELGYAVLVVDTLGPWAGIAGDGENSSGAALEAMAPLQAAAASGGLAVLVCRHERKSGGDVGESGRGSSAFAGAVDVVLSLRRPEGHTRPTVRVIQALSRFDGAPAELVIELVGGEYVSHGTAQDVAAQDALENVLKVLPTNEGDAMSFEKVSEAIRASRSTTQRAIKEHLQAGLVLVVGQGKKNDPRRYWQLEPPSVPGTNGARTETIKMVSAQTTHTDWAESKAGRGAVQLPGLSDAPSPPVEPSVNTCLNCGVETVNDYQCAACIKIEKEYPL